MSEPIKVLHSLENDQQEVTILSEKKYNNNVFIHDVNEDSPLKTLTCI